MDNLALEAKNGIEKSEVKPEKEPQNEKNPMLQLEDALLVCKFGKFHCRLLLTTLFSTFASTMVTTTSSYILPAAECDLQMTAVQKGVLNAVPFVGQVGAALFTGFCVDAFGRKKFLVGGNLGIFICSIFEGLSQNYWMLLLGKMVEGVFLSFSISGTTTIVSEMTPKNVRDRVVLTVCSFMSLSLIVTALMSWAILPMPWHYALSSYFALHAWNFYLIACSIWSLLSFIMYYYLPESPKWLISHGQEDKALEVLKRIYAENTGDHPDSFPITSLKMAGAPESVSSKDISISKRILTGLKEAKELFVRPLLWSVILFSGITFVCLFAYSAMRLWYPQLSTMIEAYQKHYNSSARFCVMLTDYQQKLAPKVENVTTMSLFVQNVTFNNITEPEICIPHLSGTQTYINNIIMGAISLLCFAVSTYVVDYIGNKVPMFICFVACAACSGSLYWSNNSMQIALLVSFSCSLVQTALSLQQTILVGVFPTNLRALAFSVVIMSGRIGSLVGNILFPVLLRLGCMAPFLLLTGITLLIAFIVYFMPSSSKEGEGAKTQSP